MNKLIVFCAAMALAACATPIASKQATLISSAGKVRIGTLIYDGPYSGNLSFPGTADDESLSGRFVVVDRTSIKKSSADIIVPSNNAIPSIGTAASSESGNIDAEGHWIGQGDKGTSIRCTLSIGLRGHGIGACSDNTGNSYEIAL